MPRSYFQYLREFHEDFCKEHAEMIATPEEFTQLLIKELNRDYLANAKDNPEIIYHDTAEIISKQTIDDYKKHRKNAAYTPKRPFDAIFFFLSRLVNMQYKAATVYDLPVDELEELLLQRAEELNNGKRPKGRTADKIKRQILAELKELDKAAAPPISKEFTMYGTSPAMNDINKILATKGDFSYINKTQKAISHSTKHELTQITDPQGNKIHKFTIDRGKNSHTEILIKNLNAIMEPNKGEQKALIYILGKINEQAYKPSDGLYKDRITMNLNDFVGEPWNYGSIVAARRYWKKVIIKLLNIGVATATKRTSGRPLTLEEGAFYLFPGYTIKNNILTIGLNTMLDWSFILQFYTAIPSYSFGLQNRAFQLLQAISYKAQMEAEQIAQTGHFYISFKAIHQALYLPEPENIKDTNGKIKGAIEKAIDEISDTDKGKCLKLTPDYSHTATGDDTAKIEDYLENGRLKVEPCGDYKERFTKFAQLKAGKIKKAAQDKEKRQRKRKTEQQPQS